MATFCSRGWLPDITTQINDSACAIPDVCKLRSKKVKKEVAMFADDTAVQRVKLTMKTCERILAVFY